MAGFAFKISHIRLFLQSLGNYRSESRNADHFGKINQPGINSMQVLPK